MGIHSELITQYSNAIRPDDTPLQFCLRVSGKCQSRIDMAILLRTFFDIPLVDCILIVGAGFQTRNDSLISSFASSAKQQLADKQSIDELVRVYLLGFIPASDVVDLIVEFHHDDGKTISRIATDLRQRNQNGLIAIADQLDREIANNKLQQQ